MPRVAEFAKTLLPDMTMRTQNLWDPHSFPSIRKRIFISWEPPPLSFLKVNFDSSMTDETDRARFVIRGLDSWLIATGDVWLVEISIPGVELRGA